MSDSALPPPAWLAQQPSIRAPDGSEVRELVRGARASLVHCCLAGEAVSRAVRHRTVEELWYVLSGQGELWRKSGELEEVVALAPGCSLSLAPGVAFQFRNTGAETLALLIATSPAWPGTAEALPADGPWPPRL